MDKYLKAIKKNICPICVDSSNKGRCKLTVDETCAVELFLPKIVEAIHKVRNDNMEEYEFFLREEVCSNCHAGKSNDYCYLREDKNCSLNRYYPLIIDIILKVDQKVFS